MRQWAVLLAGAAVWLFLLAVPAFADGGPHIAGVNSGTATGTLNSDSCAGCHRAHTAQAAYLLKEEVPALCLTCHNGAGTGATTDVENGLQYEPASDGSRTSPKLGALRAGGFANAYIASNKAARLASNSSNPDFMAKVPVASTPQAVTSKHMSLTGGTVGAKVWGNGADNSGAGGTTTLNCTSCHNPHGNGQYRILNKQPAGEAGTAVFPTTDAVVTDGALGTLDINGRYPTRNYTVQQWNPNTSTRMLLAGDVIAGAFGWQAGDYFHRNVPWTSTSGRDGPNGLPNTFDGQMNTWCAQCHTRYLSTDGGDQHDDSIFTFRHETTGDHPCTTCHVAHGSNAQMTGFNSTHEYFPGQGTDPSTTANPDSRLLKVDNRGTCQLCHDPTNTIGPNQFVGPTPVPYVP